MHLSAANSMVLECSVASLEQLLLLLLLRNA
jgi:hypothetical protein